MAKPVIPPAGLAAIDAMAWIREAGCLVALGHPTERRYLRKLTYYEKASTEQLIADWIREKVRRYCFRLPPHVIVIDIDVNAVAQWREMQARFGIRNTRIVRTPSGGLHVYLYVDPETPIRHGVDVLRDHGFERCDVFTSNSALITGPGSQRDASGDKCAGHYSWCTPQTDLAHATPALAEALKPPPVPEREYVEPRPFTGDLHPVCESILNDDLNKLATCSSGSRNKTLYTVSANLYAMAAAGEIPASGLEAQLIEAAKACGLADKEESGLSGIKKTIAGGRKRGEASPRCLASYRENYDRARARAAHNNAGGVRA